MQQSLLKRTKFTKNLGNYFFKCIDLKTPSNLLIFFECFNKYIQKYFSFLNRLGNLSVAVDSGEKEYPQGLQFLSKRNP